MVGLVGKTNFKFAKLPSVNLVMALGKSCQIKNINGNFLNVFAMYLAQKLPHVYYYKIFFNMVRFQL